MKEITKKEMNIVLRALIKEFKGRYMQYKDSKPREAVLFVEWEQDGWQWEWEVYRPLHILELCAYRFGGYNWKEVWFDIRVSDDADPAIDITAPVAEGMLRKTTGSLVKWIKKEILADWKDSDIEVTLTALG
jgi:hypothetical protein